MRLEGLSGWIITSEKEDLASYFGKKSIPLPENLEKLRPPRRQVACQIEIENTSCSKGCSLLSGLRTVVTLPFHASLYTAVIETPQLKFYIYHYLLPPVWKGHSKNKSSAAWGRMTAASLVPFSASLQSFQTKSTLSCICGFFALVILKFPDMLLLSF